MSKLTIAAVIGATAAVASTAVSINQQKKASKAQARQQELSARRSQRQAIREAQIRRAQSQVQAGAMGVTGGSGLAGGQASLSSQLGGSLGFAGQMSGLSQQITMAQSRAQTAGAVAGLGMQAFQNSDTIGAGLDELFS
jgi:hypothetical protein